MRLWKTPGPKLSWNPRVPLRPIEPTQKEKKLSPGRPTDRSGLFSHFIQRYVRNWTAWIKVNVDLLDEQPNAAIYGGGRVGLAYLLRAQEKKREGMADSCFGGVVPARKALSSPLSSPSRLKSYSHPHLRRRRVLFLSMAASDPSHPSLLVFSGLLSHLIFFFHSRIGFFFSFSDSSIVHEFFASSSSSTSIRMLLK